MTYRRRLRSGIVITSTRVGHARQLEMLQETVFPMLAPDERFKEAHYLKHIELFPEGQFVALAGERVVGMTTSIRYAFDFDHPQHTFAEVIEGGWLTSHDPGGPWLYGVDLGTHPDYRRRGIARALYRARQDTVHRLGLKGQVILGMLNGYGALKDRMTAQDYYESLLRGERIDPTLSVQLRIGFEARGLIPGYVSDPTCDGYGALLVLDASKKVDVG